MSEEKRAEKTENENTIIYQPYSPNDNHNHFVGTVLKEGRNLTVFDTENVRENEWCEKTKCILK